MLGKLPIIHLTKGSINHFKQNAQNLEMLVCKHAKRVCQNTEYITVE